MGKGGFSIISGLEKRLASSLEIYGDYCEHGSLRRWMIESIGKERIIWLMQHNMEVPLY